MDGPVFKIKDDIAKHLSDGNIGERLRDGFRVVILGEPNAGKSSLLNSIAKREAVIVSDIAGTTRDAIDIHLDINGYPVIFTDTAGLRNTDEQIEQKGNSLDLGLIRDESILDYEDLPDPIESAEDAITQLEMAVDLIKDVVKELKKTEK